MSARYGCHDALFQALLATAVDGIIVIDGQGIVRVYNHACERLFLYSSDEVVGRNVRMLMPEPHRHQHDGYLQRCQTTGERRIIGIGREVVGRRKNGTTFPMYLSVGEGVLDGVRLYVGILHDLSEARTAAAVHQRTLQELSSIVKYSEDAIIGRTLEGTVTSWNPGAERIFGYSAAEMIGHSLSIIFPDELVSEEEAIISKLREGRSVSHYETTRRRKDGVQIHVSLSVSPIRDAAGDIVGASKIVRDITDRKAAETRFRQLQSEMAHVSRLTAMGQLTSAIAHELNQPLTAVANFVDTARIVLEGVQDPNVAKIDQFLAKGAAQIERAGEIIRRLREFVEKRKVSRTTESVNSIVQDAIALGLLSSSDVNVTLKTELEPGLAAISLDRIQIQQVLVNLIRNAIEAMHASKLKEITISTKLNGPLIEIAVADTGPGIPPEIAGRLFQPFSTTKSTGMGIGLMICRSIVEAHGGTICAAPRAGGGTVFTIQLPPNPE